MLKQLAILLFLSQSFMVRAQLVVPAEGRNHYTLIGKNNPAWIYVDATETTLVQLSAQWLQQDIEAVCGYRPTIIHQLDRPYRNIICIGSYHTAALLQKLVADRKLSPRINTQWEAYQIESIAHPYEGINHLLVIAGTDRRGVAYGVLEFSRQMGVSPWHWWADVPVIKKPSVIIDASTRIIDSPRVKYRGIFINDEAPALSNWSKEKFGGFNHRFYEKVFELMLRLKANYIWPAMWGNAFYDDDSLNRQTADDYGIVIGTSHHEPLMRAHDEWRRYGKGKWNYDSNATNLRAFWTTGMQRATNEKIVTIGMRGDGDEPMSRETATALLEQIVKDQRDIIGKVTGKPAAATPQIWALYKEVQDYYDKGMRVPDDVTLLLCDDNWGNIRRLPRLNEPKRKGGYGIYYHFDYVGGPRNYKWINTNNIARVWEQMHLAWEYDARQLWIVNVGDIKPMELPISFFLDYAWNPKRWNADNLPSYYQQWAAQQFGNAHSKQIGHILSTYARLIARKKPELLTANTYDLWDEWGPVVKEWNDLFVTADDVYRRLSTESKDAYYQLVLHPVEAATNLHRMYYSVAINQAYAKQNYLAANRFADEAKYYYANDSLITIKYHQLNKGKWNNMMSQTHIGYTYWQQPPFNKMPSVQYVSPTTAVTQPLTDTLTEHNKTMIPANIKGNIFYERDKIISINATHYTRAVNKPKMRWQVIPNIARSGDGITTFPVTQTATIADAPSLFYEMYSSTEDSAVVQLYFSPTLNLHNTSTGLQFAFSVDGETPQIISLNKDDNDPRQWNKWVADNVIIKKIKLPVLKKGKHTICYRALDPAIVLQKLVVLFNVINNTYLGPTETRYTTK